MKTKRKYKVYEAYKDSGIEWLEQIPKKWNVKKLSYCFDEVGSGTTPSSNDNDYYDNGDIPWVITGDLNDGEIKNTSKKITEKALKDYSTLKIYPPNSLVIAMYGATICKLGILRMPSTTNQACCVLSEPRKYNVKYTFYWLLANKRHIISLAYGGGQPNISQDVIRNMKVTVPSLVEQQKIAAFLDREISKLDQLVEKKERLIELLKEKRQVIINQAVTKGLDPNAPMKDSGIEWLGKVPEHWTVIKLKTIVSKIGSGKTPKGGSEIYKDEGILFLRSQNVHFDGLRLDDVVYIDETIDREMANTRVLSKDVLLNITGASIGRCSLVPPNLPDANVNQHVCILRPKFNKIVPSYLHKLICSDLIQTQINLLQTGVSREGLNFEQIANLIIAFPPNIQEQEQLSNKLDKFLNCIDELSSKLKQQIAKIKEYRQALISTAVTGKIDVRDEVEIS